MSTTEPGWYHADGDPDGTMRYFDGERWIGEPTATAPIHDSPRHAFAGAGVRFGARLIDAVIVTAIILALSAALGVDLGKVFEGAVPTTFAVTSLLVGLAYEIGLVALFGATPGKMMLGLAVVDDEGTTPPGWGPASLRWLTALAGGLPAIGFLVRICLGIASGVMINSDDENRSVEDRLGSTRVVHARR